MFMIFFPLLGLLTHLAFRQERPSGWRSEKQFQNWIEVRKLKVCARPNWPDSSTCRLQTLM